MRLGARCSVAHRVRGHAKQAVLSAGRYSSSGAATRRSRNGEFDVFLRAWILDYPDAENLLSLYYGPNRTGINFENYQNQAYDQLYQSIQSMRPGDDRTLIMKRMNRMLIEDCVFMGSVFRSRTIAVKNDLIIRPDMSGALAGIPFRFAIRAH